MANPEAWLDFEQIRHNVKNNTVDRLKQILTGLNEECGTHFSKSGKKQEIIDRITSSLDHWRTCANEAIWMKAKAVIYQVRNTGIYIPNRMSALSGALPATTHPHASYLHDNVKTSVHSSTAASTSSITHYDPYAPPRRPSAQTSAVASGSSAPKSGIRFKESPFFTIDSTVSSVVECPESTSATDRRQQSFNFVLTHDHLTKLKDSGTTYQLRLFCTSSIFYAGTSGFRTSTVPCLIEFPPTCEVRVNNTQLTANLKGLKKKPGTAPPPDIGKYVRLSTTSNRVEMVYVNSQQPVQSKKYFMTVILVEAANIDTLVLNLRQQNYRSGQDIQQKMLQDMTEDDDIVAGPQKMSLKCPLTFMRIITPCRSSKCVHPQCFDATSWFTMMEQTTTWLCPVCERTLDHKDLIVDGYFDHILEVTPESVEDVIVEADGEWHTSDNKYASARWKAAHPPRAPQLSPSRNISSDVKSPSRAPVDAQNVNGKGKASQEIFVLDSDDSDDEGRVKLELSPSYASSTNHSFEGTLPPASQTQSQVIDLTLDSDDDDDDDDGTLAIPVNNNVSNGKRKASDAGVSSPTDQLWKKGRLDASRILPPPQRPSGSVNGIGVHHLPSTSNGHVPLSPGSRYPSSFQGNTLPLPAAYPQYGRTANGIHLPPPVPNTYLARPTTNNNNRQWS